LDDYLNNRLRYDSDVRLRFVDLFCGIGGFHQALTTHADCVLACDIDENCRKVYQENFGIIPGNDIRIVKENVVDHDILTAGFPCQPFSKSGNQLGFLDKIRGTLFEDIMDIVRSKKPSVIILENVRNFESHDEGRTLAIVKGSLDEEGYYVREQILSPHQFGIPQIRQRIFIVALRKENVQDYEKFKFPEITNQDYNIDSIKCSDLSSGEEKLYAITNKQKRIFKHWNILIKAVLSKNKKFPAPTWAMEFDREYELDGKFPLTERTQQELFDELSKEQLVVEENLSKEELIAYYPPYIRTIKGSIPKWKRRFIKNNRKFWKENKNLVPKDWLAKTRSFEDTYQKLEWHVGKNAKTVNDYDIFKWMIHLRPSGIRVSKLNHIPALVAISQIPIIGPWGRKLTPREAANAQSFNHDFKLDENISVSYKQLGNSVNVDLVRLIFMEILKLNIKTRFNNTHSSQLKKQSHVDFIQ